MSDETHEVVAADTSPPCYVSTHAGISWKGILAPDSSKSRY